MDGKFHHAIQEMCWNYAGEGLSDQYVDMYGESNLYDFCSRSWCVRSLIHISYFLVHVAAV